MRMTLDLLHEFANTRIVILFHNCMWQSKHQSQCLFPRVVWTNRWIVHFQRVSPFLHDLRLRFRLPVLSLVLSQPNKTRLSISWALEPNGCSAKTGLPVLKIGFLVFSWVCWESLPPPATSEPNSFIQLSLKEIFGGSLGDAFSFWYMTSPVPIMISFGIQ